MLILSITSPTVWIELLERLTVKLAPSEPKTLMLPLATPAPPLSDESSVLRLTVCLAKLPLLTELTVPLTAILRASAVLVPSPLATIRLPVPPEVSSARCRCGHR